MLRRTRLTTGQDRPQLSASLAWRRRAVWCLVTALIFSLIFVSLSLLQRNNFVPWHGLASNSLRARNSLLLGTLAFSVVGFALPIAGAAIQVSTQNRLASPFTLGVIGAATLGFVLARFVFNLTNAFAQFGLMSALSISVATLMLVLAQSRHVSGTRLVVIGLLFSSLLALINYVLQYQQGLAPALFQWTSTLSLSYTWTTFYLAAPLLLVSTLSILLLSKQLSLYAAGPQRAQHLGLRVKQLRLVVNVLVVVSAVNATFLVGPLTFVGLVLPAAARALLQTSAFLPTALCGGLLGVMMLLLANIFNTLYLAISPQLFVTMLASPLLLGLMLRRGV